MTSSRRRPCSCGKAEVSRQARKSSPALQWCRLTERGTLLQSKSPCLKNKPDVFTDTGLSLANCFNYALCMHACVHTCVCSVCCVCIYLSVSYINNAVSSQMLSSSSLLSKHSHLSIYRIIEN